MRSINSVKLLDVGTVVTSEKDQNKIKYTATKERRETDMKVRRLIEPR